MYWGIYVLFGLSCAKQTSPTGGPKDTIPPILIKSIPTQEQINYKGKSIDLIFSEMVILDNPKEQIIITPTTESKYEAVQKNNRITLKFEEAFKDSSTYTVNFREAIKDITEKNPVKNLQLAFSTGSYIDSLSIQGSTTDLLKGIPLKEVTIALLENQDTLSIFKHKPTYITKSDKDGKYTLSHVKHGTYYLYAINDKNKNLITDSKNESYGFIANPIILSKDTSNLPIPLVYLDARPLKVTSAKPYNTYYTIKNSKKLTEYKVKSTTTNDSLVTCYGEDQSIINVYNTVQIADSLQISFSGKDSIGNQLDTSLYLKFATRKVDAEKYNYEIKETYLLKQTNQLYTEIWFNKPTAILNSDSLYYQTDSTTMITFHKKEMTWNYARTRLIITKRLEQNTAAPEMIDEKTSQTNKTKPREFRKQFVAGNKAFISVENDSTKASKKETKIYTPEQMGTIKVKVKTDSTHYVVELLNKNFSVIRTSRSQKEITWENLHPEDYKIRLIQDTNNDGIWNPGNYNKGEEPEKIIFYKGEKGSTNVNLKANWELGPLLITY